MLDGRVILLVGLNRPQVALAVNAGDGVYYNIIGRLLIDHRAVFAVIGQRNLIVHHLEQSVLPRADEVGARVIGNEFNPE